MQMQSDRREIDEIASQIIIAADSVLAAQALQDTAALGHASESLTKAAVKGLGYPNPELLELVMHVVGLLTVETADETLRTLVNEPRQGQIYRSNAAIVAAYTLPPRLANEVLDKGRDFLNRDMKGSFSELISRRTSAIERFGSYLPWLSFHLP